MTDNGRDYTSIGNAARRANPTHANASAELATTTKGYAHPGSMIVLPDMGGTIHLQYGHPQEVGRNGCFTTDVIRGLISNLSVYQAAGHPMATFETDTAITCLEEALVAIDARKRDRADRGVHQTDKA